MTDDRTDPTDPADGITHASDEIDLDGPRPDSAAQDLAAVADVHRHVMEQQLAEAQDKYLRLMAEFDNFRKRAAREREAASHHGQGVVIKGLLEGLDDMARCVALDAATTDAATVLDGVRLVEQKLLKSLAGHGLEVVDPSGRPFDPALHEALTTAPAASAEDDSLVAQVYQVGYVFNGQLLRPARVVVTQWNG
jgi:molecular chaperone GrpE